MDCKMEKGVLVIRIPLTDAIVKAAPVAKSGKSRLIASTKGFTKIEGTPEGVSLGLNLIGPL